MAVQARYVHTNLIARDAQRLVKFYSAVFGCEPVPPERSLAGRWLEQGTGVRGAEIRGVHLRLPGHGPQAPTLEVFQYNRSPERPRVAPNTLGYGHIAFAVPDVQAARDAVLAAGGHAYGEVVTTDVPAVGRLTFVYVTDPEGNIVELQNWQP